MPISTVPSHLEHVYARASAETPVVTAHHHEVVHPEDVPRDKPMAWAKKHEAKVEKAAKKRK